MNRAQYERGAVLLVPNQHAESIFDLDTRLLASLYGEAQRIAKGMIEAFGATGLNVFQNNGVRAGQSISHYHIHLVPRYETSRPWLRFKESDFGQTPLHELQLIAHELRSALERQCS
jgi:histidine triad (HIT) family protein